MRALSALIRTGPGLLGPLSLLGVCACTGVLGESEERVGEAELAIQGGYVDEGDPNVVGITSRGQPNCSEPVYGSTHSWGQYLKETVYYAAEIGGYDAPLWVYGQPTDPWYNTPVGGDCVENNCSVCYAGECTRYCIDEVHACPKGYKCDAVDEGKICKRIEEEEPEPDDADDGNGADTAEGDGCSAGGTEDPTNPVPWKPALSLALVGLALVRARSRR